jgi:hypothetical protein
MKIDWHGLGNKYYKETNTKIDIKWLESNIEVFILDNWFDVSEIKPEENTQVLGYFPYGDESGKKVSTAIMGKNLHSDFPNSTSSFFEATHWIYLPTYKHKQNE